MTTIHEVLQFRVHQLSAKINDLKMANHRVDENGHPLIVNDKIATSIGRSHPEWAELKRQVSLCLTCIKIFKQFGKAPSKPDFRKAIRSAGSRKFLLTHAAAGDKASRNSFLFEAYNSLVQTEKDLKANPTRFDDAGGHAEKRREEAAHARA